MLSAETTTHDRFRHLKSLSLHSSASVRDLTPAAPDLVVEHFTREKEDDVIMEIEDIIQPTLCQILFRLCRQYSCEYVGSSGRAVENVVKIIVAPIIIPPSGDAARRDHHDRLATLGFTNPTLPSCVGRIAGIIASY